MHTHEALVWRLPLSLPYGGRYFGRDSAEVYIKALRKSFHHLELDLQEVFAVGDVVVLNGRQRGSTAKERDFDLAWSASWHLKDGKVAGVTEYSDTAGLLAGFGDLEIDYPTGRDVIAKHALPKKYTRCGTGAPCGDPADVLQKKGQHP